MVTAGARGLEDKDEEANVGIGQELEGDTRMRSFGSEDYDKFVSKGINASLVLGFGTFAITKLLTIDHDYWHVS